MKLDCFGQIFEKNTEMSVFTKICPVGAQLFHADRRTDRHDKVNSTFLKFLWSYLKIGFFSNRFYERRNRTNAGSFSDGTLIGSKF